MSNKQTKPIVLMLAGPAGCGKTTLGGSLKVAFDAHGLVSVRVSFADPLKAAVNEAEQKFGLPLTDWNDREAKEKARPLLVELGRHLRRKDPDVFVRHLVEHAAKNAAALGAEVLVIDDWRYMNEYRFLAARLETVFPIRVHRCSAEPANDEEARSINEIDGAFYDLPGCMDVAEWFNPVDRALKANAVADYVAAVFRSRQTPFVGEASS